MNRLLCRLCNQTLRENVTFEHAISIAHHHQLFFNEYVDDRCPNRDEKYVVADTFILIDLTEKEVAEINYDRYMKQSNYN